MGTHKNSDMDGGSWMAVRTGPVLSYCEHPAHVVGRASAWNNAMVKARQILRAERDQRATERDRVIAQITALAHDTWDITGLLFVRSEAVTFRCHDRLTVQSIRRSGGTPRWSPTCCGVQG